MPFKFTPKISSIHYITLSSIKKSYLHKEYSLYRTPIQKYIKYKKKKEYYDGHSRHCWYNNGQDTSDIEQMALRAMLSLMAGYFTDTYGKPLNQWE